MDKNIIRKAEKYKKYLTYNSRKIQGYSTQKRQIKKTPNQN